MGMTCYEVLKVTLPVTMEELKAAYRKAAALNHPDCGGSHAAMVEINSAFGQAKWELEHFRVRNNPHYSQPQPHPQPTTRPPQPQPSPEQIRQFWMYIIDSLIEVHEANDYKSGWVAYQLLESKIMPPMVAWEYLGGRLGHKSGWAHYKFKEWRFDSPKQHAN